MATPTNNSSPISLLGIQREVFNNNYNASNSHSDISLTDLSEEADENFNTNSPSTPDGNTPHAMSEWYNYDHDATAAFSWGTPGSITTNASSIFNQSSVEDENGSSVELRSFVKLSHPSSGTINFQFETRRIGDGDGDSTTTTNTASLTYTGTLTSLEARIVFTSIDFQRTGGGDGYTSDADRGEQHEIYSGSSHMTNTGGTDAAINLPSSGQTEDSNNNITRPYRSMSTTGNSSIGLQVSANAAGSNFAFSTAEIEADSSSEKIKIELRANSSSTVTLYERVGAFRMLADSFVDATT